MDWFSSVMVPVGIGLFAIVLAIPLWPWLRWLRGMGWQAWIPSLMGCVVLVAGLLGSWWRGEAEKDTHRQILRGEVASLAGSLEPALAAELTFRAADTSLASYRRITGYLTSYVKQSGKRYAYTMRMDANGVIRFGPENFTTEYSPTVPGTEYNSAPRELMDVFRDAKGRVTEPYMDEYGWFVSALAPVLDPATGRVILVLGIDEKADVWVEKVDGAKALFLQFTLVLLLGLIVGSLLLLRRRTWSISARERLKDLEGWLALSFGLWLTAGLTFAAWDGERRSRIQVFRQTALAQFHYVEQEFRQLGSFLTDLSLFFENSETVEPAEFRLFAKSMVEANSLKTVQWLPKIRMGSEDSLSQVAAHMLGLPKYRVWNLGNTVSCKDRYPVFYSVPNSGSQLKMGMDICSEESRRQGLLAAIASDLSTATLPFEFVQGPSGTKAIAVLSSVRKDSKILGLIAAEILPQELLERVFRNSAAMGHVSYLRLSMVDSDGKLLPMGTWPENAPEPVRGEVNTSAYAFAFGRTFLMSIRPGEGFSKAYPMRLPWVALGGGLSFTFLAALLVGLLSRRRNILEQEVLRRTQELRAEERLLRTVMNSIPNPVYFKDIEGRYRMVNPEFLRMLDKSESEVLGHFVGDLFEQTVAKEIHALDEIALSSNEVQLYEKQIPVSKGVKHFSFHKSRVVSERGDVVGIVGVLLDIGRIKRTEAELREATERAGVLARKAESASEAKSRFLATMSHELRTPLNGVIGMNSLLQDTALDKVQQEYVGVVSACATSLLAIVNDVLDLSRLDAGKMQLEYSEFDLETLVQEVMATVSSLRKPKVLLQAAIDPTLPKRMVSDVQRIRQVLVNLLGNALKFTERGTVLLRVGTTDIPRQLKFEIIDTGVGINAKVLPMLFNPFTQADNSVSRKYGGSGLGLAICRQLVDLLGGEIQVESSEGVGSAFTFSNHGGAVPNGKRDS